jgi:hypothetical protein
MPLALIRLPRRRSIVSSADTHNVEPGDWRRLPEPVRRLRAGAD